LTPSGILSKHPSPQATTTKTFEFEMLFLVVNMLDLNQEPFDEQALSGSGHKRFGCLCCKSGPLSASVHLDKIGCVPGEPLTICAEINNKSNKTMNGSSLKLIQKIDFHAENSSKSETTTIAELSQGAILPGQEDVWSDVQV
jgi:hypothetical protein